MNSVSSESSCWNLLRAAVVVALGFGCVFFGLNAIYAQHLDWNTMRLSPVAALLHGLPIYPPEGAGVITGYIYTPFGALAYAPVAWMKDISSMTCTASVLATAYFAAPFIWLAWWAVRGGEVTPWEAAGVCVASLLAAALYPALRYAAVMVHVEAPAVAFVCLAIIQAAQSGASGHVHARWAGALAVCAVLSKQTLLPAWCAIGITLAVLFGARKLWQYLVGGGVVAIPFAIWLALFGNWPAFLYNCLSIPSRHPWSTSQFAFRFGESAAGQSWAERAAALGEAFVAAAPYLWPAVALAAWSGLQCVRRRQESLPPLLVLAGISGFVGFAQLPLAFASLVKVGGDLNNLAPFLTPLLLMAAALSLYALATLDSCFRTSLRTLLAATLVALIACNVPRTVFLVKTIAIRSDPNAPILAFLREHPRQVYLPWNPLHTFVSDGVLYHFEYGVFDRALAGRPIAPDHFRAHLPSSLRWVVVRKHQSQSGHEMFRRYLPNLLPIPSPPGLDEWVFYGTTTEPPPWHSDSSQHLR